MWAVATTDTFDGWFAELGEDSQAEIIAKVNLLKLSGPRLSRPHADTLKGSKHANMKELRADTRYEVLRIAFAFDPERSAILLVGGDKSGVGQKRFYKELIAKADALYDAHLESTQGEGEEKEASNMAKSFDDTGEANDNQADPRSAPREPRSLLLSCRSANCVSWPAKASGSWQRLSASSSQAWPSSRSNRICRYRRFKKSSRRWAANSTWSPAFPKAPYESAISHKAAVAASKNIFCVGLGRCGRKRRGGQSPLILRLV